MADAIPVHPSASGSWMDDAIPVDDTAEKAARVKKKSAEGASAPEIRKLTDPSTRDLVNAGAAGVMRGGLGLIGMEPGDVEGMTEAVRQAHLPSGKDMLPTRDALENALINPWGTFMTMVPDTAKRLTRSLNPTAFDAAKNAAANEQTEKERASIGSGAIPVAALTQYAPMLLAGKAMPGGGKAPASTSEALGVKLPKAVDDALMTDVSTPVVNAAKGAAAHGLDALSRIAPHAGKAIGGAVGSAVGHPFVGAGAGEMLLGSASKQLAAKLAGKAEALRGTPSTTPSIDLMSTLADEPMGPMAPSGLDLARDVGPSPAPSPTAAGGQPISFAAPVEEDGTSLFPTDFSKVRRPQAPREPIDIGNPAFDEFMGYGPSDRMVLDRPGATAESPSTADAPDAEKSVVGVDALARKHARADALPANRAEVLRQIFAENGINDYDSAQADAAYQAWKDGGRKGPKPTANLGGTLDSFNESGRGASSVQEAFEKATRGIKTWRELRDVMPALSDAVGTDLRLPDDVIQRHVTQDVANDDANAHHESVDDVVGDLWGEPAAAPEPTPPAPVAQQLGAALDRPLPAESSLPVRARVRRGPDWQLNPQATGIPEDVSAWPPAAQNDIARLEEGGTSPGGGRPVYNPDGVGARSGPAVSQDAAENLAARPAPAVEEAPTPSPPMGDVRAQLNAKLDPAQGLALQSREVGVGQRFNAKVEADKIAGMKPGERQAYFDVLARMHGKSQAAPLAKRFNLTIPSDAPKYSTQPAHVRSASMEGAHTVHQQATGAPWQSSPINEMSGKASNAADDAAFLERFDSELNEGRLPSGKDMERARVLRMIQQAVGG